MWLASKFILRSLAAVFAGAAIIVVAAAWRFSEGPISVGFLSPYVQDSLAASGTDLGVTIVIDDTVLAWKGFERGLDIVVVGLDVLDGNGGRIVRIPEVAVGFDTERLYVGDFVPTTIDIVGAKLNLRRARNGAFGIGLDESEGDIDSIVAFLRRFTLAPDNRQTGASLRRLSVLDASVVLRDEISDVVWTAPTATLIVNRGEDTLSADLLVDLALDDDIKQLVVAAAFDYVQRATRITLDISELDPLQLAEKTQGLAPLARLQLPVTGRVEFDVSARGQMSNVHFDIEGGEGAINLAPVFDSPSRVDRLAARGAVDLASKAIVFDDLRLERGEARANLTGHINTSDKGPFVSLGGRISGFTPPDINAYWPPRFAAPVHAWFSRNIKEGVVTEGTVRLNVGPEQLQGGGLSKDAAEARLTVSGVTSTYFADMPPITDGAGTLRLTGDSLDLELSEGSLGRLVLREGSLQIVERSPKTWDASLEFVASGANDDVLRAIDSEPLRLAERFGIEAERIGGVSATRICLGFPIRPDIALADIRFAAASNVRDATLDQAFGDVDLSRGHLTLEVTKAGLRAEGTMALDDVPVSVVWDETFQPADSTTTALRFRGRFDDAARNTLGFPTGSVVVGPVDAVVDIRSAGRTLLDARFELDLSAARLDAELLQVTKPPGQPATASFFVTPLDDGGTKLERILLTSDILVASGVVELGPDRVLRRIDLDRLNFGRTDVAASIRPRAPEGFILAVNGPRIDAGPFLDAFFDQTAGDLPPVNLSVTTREMILSDHRTLFDVVGEFNYVERLESLRASGSINAEAPISVELFTTSEGPRRLTISGSNAGGLARTTGLFDDAVGGTLLVSASLRESPRGPVIDGRMEIEGLRVRQATSLSRVLTLASLTGILETLDGDGLQFSRADVPFRFHNGILEIIDARAFGPSLGITLDGEINGNTDEISMFGTLIPAYTINSVLGEIPLIGTLLVGRQGEGVFALTYGVSGPVEQPVITVNPLTALAPGFLRNFFAIFVGGAQPDADDPDRPFLEDQPG